MYPRNTVIGLLSGRPFESFASEYGLHLTCEGPRKWLEGGGEREPNKILS
jgi:hypothetical protein